MATNLRPEIFVPADSPIHVPGSVRIQRIPPSNASRQTTPSPTLVRPGSRRFDPDRLWQGGRLDPSWARGNRPDWYDVPLEEEEDGGGGPTDLTVPPEILALAEKAATHWAMRVTGMTLAATKPEKGWGAIWRIETDRGPRSLKLLHRPFERNLFSIYAQEYLTKRKARVAPLVKTKSGQFYTILENRMFIVTDWIEGLQPASKVTVDGAAQLCTGLAEFHRFSQGYEPPRGAYHASRIHRWPSVYQKVRTKIDWFEHLARAYYDMPAGPVLLEVLPRFRAQADDAIARLERSAYRKLVGRGEKAWGLVHQDE